MESLNRKEIASLLRKVEKPGRYVGGEFGAVTKPEAALRVVVSYPDLYEIGMSNSAIRILYGLLNGIPDVSCERVFAIAPDFEQALRGAQLPLYSLETAAPLASFDLIGFSVGYELTLTNFLAILDAGHIALEADARGPHEPIVLAGGPATTNPVPLGRFVDAVFIGEAEGWAGECFGRMAQMKRRGAGREDLLDFLRGHPAVWYRGRRGQVRRAFWKGFATEPAKAVFPVPSIRVVQDHGSVEIMRGCPNACRFCHATVLYRPRRLKDPDVIRAEVQVLVEAAGYRHISLSSLSSGDFREIHDLVRGLNSRYAQQRVSFSLPSLRIDSLSLALLQEISEVRKSGLTFAVETARPAWQKEVRKPVPMEKTIAVLREAHARGWKAAKFYFMVGLPPSFEEDEAGAIVEFLREVRSATKMDLNVSVASFIPKPHTPWERAAQIGEEEALRRIMGIKKNLTGGGFKIGYHAPILSLLEGLVARGDERAGSLVLEAYRRGARLDAWEEHVRLDVWRGVIAGSGEDTMAEICRAREPGDPVPWNGISLAFSSSVAAEAPPLPDRRADLGAQFPVPPASSPSEWSRVILRFTKTGPSAYISHLDLMTLFERALARAGLRPRFTEGFNPKPRLEFASPLSLGVESTEEIAGIDLIHPVSPSEIVERLNKALPSGLEATRAAVAPHDGVSRRHSLMSLFWGADYEVIHGAQERETIRLPAGGPSIRKTLEPRGLWTDASIRRIATWASGPKGEPVSYFDALCAPRSSAGGG